MAPFIFIFNNSMDEKIKNMKPIFYKIVKKNFEKSVNGDGEFGQKWELFVKPHKKTENKWKKLEFRIGLV